MAALIVNNTAQVRLIWSLDGTPFAINVLHGIMQGVAPSVGQANANDLGAAFTSRIGALTLNQLSNRVKLTQVGVRSLDQANEPEYVNNPATPAGGDGTSELLPLNVAACVTLRTAKAGRSYRGRVYVTGWGEGASQAGVMGTFTQTEATSLVTAFKTAMADAGFTMSVASRKLGVSNEVTAIACRDQIWDTQRRRIKPGI